MQNNSGIIKRIIFLRESRFCLRSYQRDGIELLEKNGFQVEVWNLMPILHPEAAQDSAHLDLFNFDGLRVFSEKRELYNKLSNLSYSDFVKISLNHRPFPLAIYRVLSKSRANYAVSCTGLSPSSIIRRGWGVQFLKEKIKGLASFRRLGRWRYLFMRVLPLWCLGIRPASLMFAAGEKYMNYRYFLRFPVDKNTELLQIHALDYDIYLKEKDGPCSEKSIAVFIDVYYPFHPDYGIFKTESPVSADNYYRLLNNFFDLVEEKTGLEVIIAAHPRSDYENHPDYFKGRKCVKGKTVDLIKECRLVLAHFSVALHLANLFYKPVTFMTFSDLYKTHEGDSLAEYAKSFNKKPVFIDKDMNIDWEQELMVSKEHYDDYRRSYIKVEGSEGLPFWQIVANKLRDKF